MATFIVTQRKQHGVPQAAACRELEVSQAWFYKWRQVVKYGDPSPRHARCEQLKVAIRRLSVGYQPMRSLASQNKSAQLG